MASAPAPVPVPPTDKPAPIVGLEEDDEFEEFETEGERVGGGG